jgi:hypothetical protein
VLRRVKGVLFADYVRMMRGNKHVDWASLLPPEDFAFLKTRIEPDGWYPMESFERMGDVILAMVACGNLDAVRMWGRFSVDQLVAAQPNLLAPGDPVETMHRFHVLRGTYFDFEALDVLEVTDREAKVVIRYHMGPSAEEAAAYQTMGFFERLLEVGGAESISARFVEKSWAGDPRTLLDLSWEIVGEKPPGKISRPQTVARLKL